MPWSRIVWMVTIDSIAPGRFGINLITIGSQAEAITRNGSMRYGAAYFGRLVDELLGRAGSVSLSVALGNFLWNFGVSRTGVVVASMYGNLIPIVAVLITLIWLGCLLMAGAGVISLTDRKRRIGAPQKARKPKLQAAE